MRKDLPDVQNKEKNSEPIEKVGVRNLTMRMGTKEVDFSCYINLPGSQKGINMSRLPRIINKHSDHELSFNLLETMLEEFLEESERAVMSYIKGRYKHKRKTQSPASKISYDKFYDVEVEFRKRTDEDIQKYVTVTVPYISTCPCSTELVSVSREEGVDAYPHMQRSKADITVQAGDKRKESIIDEIITDVEREISSIPHKIVKREDELAIAQSCGETQVFVEDAARIIRNILEERDYPDYVAVIEHQESIHEKHDAIAVTRKGVEGGLR